MLEELLKTKEKYLASRVADKKAWDEYYRGMKGRSILEDTEEMCKANNASTFLKQCREDYNNALEEYKCEVTMRLVKALEKRL